MVHNQLSGLFISLLVVAGAGCGDDSTTNPQADAAGMNPGDGSVGADSGAGDPDAGGEPVSDPAEPGPHAVHITDGVSVAIDNDSATLTICAPSSDGGATASPGPHPLVIASPGFQLPRTQYRWMCDHLATWGYLVLLQDYARGGGIFDPPDHQTLAEDIGRVIDWALGADSGIAAQIDADAIAVAGHSLGGKVSILAAILDSRVKAVVGWDPVDANPPIGNGSPSVTPELMGSLTIPLAVIGETLDSQGTFMSCAPAADNYVQYFEHACAAADALEVTVPDADHMDWVGDRSSCGFTCSACATGPADDAITQRVTRRVTAGFLELHLRGATGMRAYLIEPGEGAIARDQVPGC